MRGVIAIVALIGLVACAPKQEEAIAPPPTATATGSLPNGFPQADLAARSAECVVYLGLSEEANARPAGHDGPIMQQAAGQWRASMEIDGAMSKPEIAQLVASSVNMLMPTPADQRDAASAWCVENAPEPDPAE